MTEFSTGPSQTVAMPTNANEFDGLMQQLGEILREIDALTHERDQKVAEIDKEYSAARAPLVDQYNAIHSVCEQYANNPDNKAQMTTKEAPQTADLTHSVVRWTDDHTGTIELADGVTEAKAIRALQHRKGGGIFIKTERKLVWGVIRSKAQQAVIEAMPKYFIRKYKPTSVTLYVKPAQTPKPDGKTAERRVEKLS